MLRAMEIFFKVSLRNQGCNREPRLHIKVVISLVLKSIAKECKS
jgi:hypothetical protein